MRKLLLTITLTIITLFSIAQDTLDSKASFYHKRYIGRKTSSGEVYSSRKLTAASNDYPLGTRILIINKKTGKSVTVTVNDRMAKWIKNHIDLSQCAFEKIAFLKTGVQRVRVVQLL